MSVQGCVFSFLECILGSVIAVFMLMSCLIFEELPYSLPLWLYHFTFSLDHCFLLYLRSKEKVSYEV